MRMINPRCRNWTGGLFLTDGGIETTLIFHEGWPLPYFAAFDLFKSAEGHGGALRLLCALCRHGAGLRARVCAGKPNLAGEQRLGRQTRLQRRGAGRRQWPDHCADAKLRDAFAGDGSAMVISGCVGPRGDGYDPGSRHGRRRRPAIITARRLRPLRKRGRHGDGHHHDQRQGGRGGRARGAAAGVPVAISFTLETDGRLPTGQGLAEAIDGGGPGDRARAPCYYMINCAHPTHLTMYVPGSATGPATGQRWASDGQRLRRAARQRLAVAAMRSSTRPRPRRRRPCRVRGRSTAPCGAASADQRAGGMLRHRPSPPRGDLPALRLGAGQAQGLRGRGGLRLWRGGYPARSGHQTAASAVAGGQLPARPLA